jgi:hypothetical protein
MPDPYQARKPPEKPEKLQEKTSKAEREKGL